MSLIHCLWHGCDHQIWSHHQNLMASLRYLECPSWPMCGNAVGSWTETCEWKGNKICEVLKTARKFQFRETCGGIDKMLYKCFLVPFKNQCLPICLNPIALIVIKAIRESFNTEDVDRRIGKIKGVIQGKFILYSVIVSLSPLYCSNTQWPEIGASNFRDARGWVDRSNLTTEIEFVLAYACVCWVIADNEHSNSVKGFLGIRF